MSDFRKIPNAVFVFGSNLSGIHGAGAARTAHEKWGAEWGIATLRGKGLNEGGGVECRNPDCSYWFCY